MDTILQTVAERTDKTIAAFSANLGKIRSGRAHAGLLDSISANAYGADTPLPHLATIAVSDARTLTVTVWDKQNTAAVEKAIRDSDLGVNPVVGEANIRVSLPALSEERRRDLAKIVGKEAEEARIAARNIRRDALAELKAAAKTSGEDEQKRLEAEVQKAIDKAVGEIDRLAADKQKELLTL